jgi:hypothetical protein
MLQKLLATIIVIVSLIIDLKYVQYIINPDIQLIIGTTIIAIIIFGDAFAGLLLAVAVFILYFRVYSLKYGVNIKDIIYGPANGNKTSNYPMGQLFDGYITPKNLEDAQTNIVSEPAYNKEIKGIKGVYNEPVYGAQGIDKMMPGYGSPFPGETFN